jgi:[acyl-carrier-protein] S-malonyltransferase
MMRTTFMFPGQGSLDAAAGRELFRSIESVRDAVDTASARSGIDIADLLCRGSAEELSATDVAQVTVFAISIGVWQHLRAHGVRPWAVMGHSAGEFTALAAAGVIDVATALDLVVERGRAMAAAAAALSPGAMAAVGGLPVDTVRQLCDEVPGCVVANENSPIQTVVSGTAEAVEELSVLARRRGALRVDRLVVGGAFHSPLMKPARRAMSPLLRAVPLHPPQCVVISSVTGGIVEDVESYRPHLCAQITRPVRWVRAMAAARLHGAGPFVQVGPGRVLASLARSCDRAADVRAARDGPTCAAVIADLGASARIAPEAIPA